MSPLAHKNIEPRRKKSKNLETYFQSISAISSLEASTQDQQFPNSQSSLQFSSQNELETTPFSHQVDNFQSCTVNDFEEPSTENVVDLGSIDTFPSRPILKNFAITNRRKFVSKWYSGFSWLEYSIMLDSAFCFACRNLNSGRTYARDVFSNTGFSHWKHALEKEKGLTKHDNSADHMIAMARWNEYERIKSNKSMSLENFLNPERSSVVKENREYLKMLIEFNRFFCLQELPYRGHDETDDSMNTGNWKEFIKMQLSTNSFLNIYSKK